MYQELPKSSHASDRAAALWASGFDGDDGAVSAGMRDVDPKGRIEAMRGFARMKGRVAGVAEPFIACLRDRKVDVRREALRQAVRWAPPPDQLPSFSPALTQSPFSRAHDVCSLAAEAMAVPSPASVAPSL